MDRQELFCWAYEKYGTEPEYLWESSPDSAILRNSSGKWYGAVLNVNMLRLGLNEDRMVFVLNVKCDPMLIGSLLSEKGFFPAYHMNKEKWISILLDDSVDDDQIKFLLDLSYELTMPKWKNKKNQMSDKVDRQG